MSSSISLRVVHTSPRRTRLKSASSNDCRDEIAGFAERLGRCPGVERVELRAVTGSLVVHHSREFDWERAGLRIVAAKPGELEEPAVVSATTPRPAVDLGEVAFALVEAALSRAPAAALAERIAMVLISSALRDGIALRRTA